MAYMRAFWACQIAYGLTASKGRGEQRGALAQSEPSSQDVKQGNRKHTPQDAGEAQGELTIPGDGKPRFCTK